MGEICADSQAGFSDFNENCFTRMRLSALMPTTTSEESGDNFEESSNKAPKEKRILIRGSVLTIHCANKAPEKRELSDGDRKR